MPATLADLAGPGSPHPPEDDWLFLTKILGALCLAGMMISSLAALYVPP